MARDGSLRLPFGDGEHVFRLRIGQLFELQDRINAPRLRMLAAAGVEYPQPIGPGRIVEELGRGNMWPHEIREIFRIALVGGGMRPAQAEITLHHHFDKYSLGELSLMAMQMLNAAFIDEAGATEKKSPEDGASATIPDGSTIEPSTGTPQSSASSLEPSINLAS